MAPPRLHPLLLPCLLLGLLAGPLAGPAAPQEAPVAKFEVPHDLQPFWRLYEPAKDADDEEGMDKAVRTYATLAEGVLDVMVDEICSNEQVAMHDEIRTLAWSLDRVKGTTRYIERARLVIDMSVGQRHQRQKGLEDLNAARDLYKQATVENVPDAWKVALERYTTAKEQLEAIGDYEFTVVCLNDMAVIEGILKHPWESGQHYKRLIELSGKLAYPEALAEGARQQIEKLKATGTDPDAPKVDPNAPKPDAGGAGGATPGTAPTPGAGAGGHGLDSYAAGSAEQTFTFELNSPKKGLEPVTLPTFAPLDQYFLWPVTWLDKDGPSDFDYQRSVSLQPWGAHWKLSREGAKFFLDSTGDGKPDLTFTPSSTPQRLEVPSPDGKSTYPIMIAVPADREAMFGMDVNYSPTQAGTRVRFNVAATMDGKVLEETWKLYDLNLNATWGDAAELLDDRITVWDDADQTHWWEPDAVLIGKSKVALPWSSVLPLGEDFYRAKLTADGKSLTLQKMDLATGFIKLDLATTVPATHVIVREIGDLAGAYFNVVPAKKGGTVKVPAGEYALAFGRIENGHKTGLQQVRLYPGHSETFKVEPGATHTLSLGAPYKLRFKTKTEGQELIVDTKSLRIAGRGGEEWAMLFDDSLQPEFEVRTAEGKKVAKPQKMAKPGVTEFSDPNEPQSVIWFPVSPRLDNSKGEKLQVRITQKSQSLLGGPFESDWTP